MMIIFNVYFYISQADFAKVSKKYKICIATSPNFFTFVAKKCALLDGIGGSGVFPRPFTFGISFPFSPA